MSEKGASKNAREPSSPAPPPPAVLTLAAALGRQMARTVYRNCQEHPDITSADDPRLLAPAKPKLEYPFWVYFIGDEYNQYVKVGVTRHVTARMNELRRASKKSLVLHGTTLGDYKIEKAFHKALAAKRAYGEWFSHGPWLQEVIDCIEAGRETDEILKWLGALKL